MKKLKKRKKAKAIIVLIAVAALLIAALSLTTASIKPVAESLMKSQSNIMCTLAINNAVMKQLNELGDQYSDLIEIVTDKDGKILALKSDSLAINAVQSGLTAAVNSALSKLPESQIKIPIGTITGWEWLSGRGPAVAMEMRPSSYAFSSLEHVFDSAGINQTRHQIILHFNVRITALLPPFSVSTDVETSVCIAETIIVGAVPEMFAGF